MRWLLLSLPLLLVAGCATMAGSFATPLVSCADPEFQGARARLAADVDTPPEPVGGLLAIQERVRIPNEGARIATPEGRFAVVDTAGAVQCSDVLSAGSDAKGEAARGALHASLFEPGRDAGEPAAVVIDVELDVRGQGRPAVGRGDRIRG